jgi:uncharacterized protein YndB with AHSA1/START domain
MTRDIVLGISIHAGAEPLHQAITTGDGLASFWTSQAKAEPEVGTEAVFGFGGAPMPLRMRVDRIEPNRIEWTCMGEFPFWEGTKVLWSLEPEAEHGGTNVLFLHTGFSDEQPIFEHGSIAHTWSTILDRLKVLGETGSATPALG